MISERKKVFIINNSSHDFSKASKFGELIYLTEGKVDSYNTNKNYRDMFESLKQAREGDYILVTSLASLNIIAGWIMGSLGLNLNLLIFKDGKYLERRMIFKENL